METKKMPKNANIFVCEKCSFVCSKKSNYEKHILTSKHKKNILGNKGDINNAKKCLINYKCINCNKIYQSRNGLWKHKKICIILNSKDNINHEEDDKNNILNLTNMVLEVVKNNSELVKQNQE